MASSNNAKRVRAVSERVDAKEIEIHRGPDDQGGTSCSLVSLSDNWHDFSTAAGVSAAGRGLKRSVTAVGVFFNDFAVLFLELAAVVTSGDSGHGDGGSLRPSAAALASAWIHASAAWYPRLPAR